MPSRVNLISLNLSWVAIEASCAVVTDLYPVGNKNVLFCCYYIKRPKNVYSSYLYLLIAIVFYMLIHNWRVSSTNQHSDWSVITSPALLIWFIFLQIYSLSKETCVFKLFCIYYTSDCHLLGWGKNIIYRLLSCMF